MKDRCWMLPKVAPFIQLGRNGDLLILFPAFKAIFERTGVKPTVFVAQEYAGLFDGISYATPWPLQVHWYAGIPAAREIAMKTFGADPVIPRWWDDATCLDVPKGATVLQCHGVSWGVDMARWPNFQTSMWERTGLPVSEMRTLPLVFDQRDVKAEEVLINAHYPQRRNAKQRPLVLVNFAGISSKFPFVPDLTRLIYPFRRQQIDVIDLGQIRAPHLYDLLGLYDRAAGLITTDTATLHLAKASKVPYVAYTVDGWSSSVPLGNCILEVKYSQAPKRLGEVQAVLERWAA
jgi:hypothetical protein